ncbi:hypothetical protein EGW08_006719, partial [Elysia chlorotica]
MAEDGPKPPPRYVRSCVTDKCSRAAPTYLNIEYPHSQTSSINPRSYGCGFSRDGRIIGSNLPVPYPRDTPFYHDLAFRRSVDWFAGGKFLGERKLDNDQPNDTFVEQCEHCQLRRMAASQRLCTSEGVEERGKPGCGRHGVKQILPGSAKKADVSGDGQGCEREDCYLIKDDPKYKAWVDGKSAARKEREKRHKEMKKTPWDVKLIPGHFAPPIRQTENETYGQHLDMLPRWPLVYPEVDVKPEPSPLTVKFRRSNMSDHPPIPDHSFAIARSEMETLDGVPLRGIIGAPYRPDTDTPAEALNCAMKNMESSGSDLKIPTQTTCNQGNPVTVVKGKGVTSNAPGLPVKDPWTFRRSAVVLGRVAGERGPGCTWPIYTPTGLEINRPIQRTVAMTAGCSYSDKNPHDTTIMADATKDLYR